MQGVCTVGWMGAQGDESPWGLNRELWEEAGLDVRVQWNPPTEHALC